MFPPPIAHNKNRFAPSKVFVAAISAIGMLQVSSPSLASDLSILYSEKVDSIIDQFPSIENIDGYSIEYLKYSGDSSSRYLREESVDIDNRTQNYADKTAIISQSSFQHQKHHRTDAVLNIIGTSGLQFDSLKVIYDGTENNFTSGGGNPILFRINRNENGGTSAPTTITGGTLESMLAKDSGKFFFVEKGASLDVELQALYMHAVGQSRSGSLHFFDIDGTARFDVANGIVGIVENADESATIVGMELASRADLTINSPDFVLINKTETFGESKGVHAYDSTQLTLGDQTNGNFILEGFDTAISLGNSTFNGKSTMFGILGAETGIYINNGQFSLDTQSLCIDAPIDGYAIDNYYGTVEITSQQSQVSGAISNDDGTISVNFGANSVYEGLTLNWYGAGETSLVFDQNSEWKVDYEADKYGGKFVNQLQALSLNGAQVDLSYANTTSNSVHAERLTGNGTFNLLVDIGEQKATQIVSGEESDGSFEVSAVIKNGATDDIPKEGILFAEDLSQKVQYSGTSSLTEAGLKIVTPTLSSQNTGSSILWYISQIDEETGPTPGIMLSGFENNYLFWRSVADTTKERFGELRQGAPHGAWGRITAGSLEQGGLSNDYQTYRLGVDAGIAENTTLGFALEIHEGDLDSSGGNGDMSAYTVAVYGLWATESGFYLDAGLRFGFMNYEFMNKAGLADSYDYTTNAFGGWIEIGQDLSLSDSFFITPHVAANFGRISTESFKSANGLNADVDAVTSAILTLGTDVSYRTPEFEIAATVAVSTEMAGDQDVQISNSTDSIWHRFDYSDTWMEYGVSATYRQSVNTQAWANIRRSAFADVDEDWRINLGFRWSF